jgi:hypothetical protein
MTSTGKHMTPTWNNNSNTWHNVYNWLLPKTYDFNNNFQPTSNPNKIVSKYHEANVMFYPFHHKKILIDVRWKITQHCNVVQVFNFNIVADLQPTLTHKGGNVNPNNPTWILILRVGVSWCPILNLWIKHV